MTKQMKMNPRAPVLREALTKDETVRWCAQPRVHLFGFPDFIIVPFMCVWCSAVFGWFATSWAQFLEKPDASQSFMLFFCSMFALVGFYMLVGRFIHIYCQCKMRYFMVTNKRVVAYSSFWPPTINSILLDDLQKIQIWRELKDRNRGTMAFGKLSLKDMQALSFGMPLSFYNATSGVVFNDLEELQSALEAVKSACSGRELQIDESHMFLSPFILSAEQRKETQDYYKKLIADAKKYERAGSDMVEKAVSANADGQLIQQHRRVYICRSVGLLFGAVASFLFATTQLAMYYRDLRSATENKNWPSAHGTITDLQVITSKGDPYLHSFRVDFNVGGKPYKCDTYSLRKGNEADQHDQLVFGTTHKVGNTVDVFYDPKDPDVSVIDRSRDLPALKSQKESGRGSQIIGAIFFGTAVFRLMSAGRRKFAPKPLKDYSLGGVLYASAFLSIWFAMLFNFLLAPIIGSLVPGQ